MGQYEIDLSSHSVYTSWGAEPRAVEYNDEIDGGHAPTPQGRAPGRRHAGEHGAKDVRVLAPRERPSVTVSERGEQVERGVVAKLCDVVVGDVRSPCERVAVRIDRDQALAAAARKARARRRELCAHGARQTQVARATALAHSAV